jgi:hypothetical protein
MARNMSPTSSNSVFAVRYAHLNAFSTLQTRRTLYAMPMNINIKGLDGHFYLSAMKPFIPAAVFFKTK